MIWQELLVAATGGGLYILVELLWRGRSHISMFLLGGLCFWLIGRHTSQNTFPAGMI